MENMMRRASLLCPTRGRPSRAEELLRSIRDTQSNDNEILFCLQEDDPALNQYSAEIKRLSIISKPRTTSYYWNLLAERSTGDFLILMGDDVTIKTKNWDIEFNRIYDQYPDGIFNIKMQDGRIGRPRKQAPDELPGPHPVITRRWYETLGYFVYPGFRHYCVDKWIDTIAKSLGRSINLYDMEFTHNKSYQSGDQVRTTMRQEQWSELDNYVYDHCDRHLQADIAALRAVMY
jgi:glycosyl transferase/beta-hydroxylase protein BlmF